MRAAGALPEDGGGIVEKASQYGIGYRDDVADAIVETRSWYAELRRRVLALAPPVETMCVRYEEVIESLI